MNREDLQTIFDTVLVAPPADRIDVERAVSEGRRRRRRREATRWLASAAALALIGTGVSQIPFGSSTTGGESAGPPSGSRPPSASGLPSATASPPASPSVSGESRNSPPVPAPTVRGITARDGQLVTDPAALYGTWRTSSSGGLAAGGPQSGYTLLVFAEGEPGTWRTTVGQCTTSDGTFAVTPAGEFLGRTSGSTPPACAQAGAAARVVLLPATRAVRVVTSAGSGTRRLLLVSGDRVLAVYESVPDPG